MKRGKSRLRADNHRTICRLYVEALPAPVNASN